MSCIDCRPIVARALVMLVMLVIASASVSAQTARPAAAAKTSRPTTTVLRDVDARLERQDSLGALDVLDSALVYDRKNGTLWNRYGSIAWGMSKTEEGPFMRPSMIRLRMRADSAFRYAVAFAPDSAEYYTDLAHYALETNLVFVRQGAKGTFEDGLKVAQAQGRTDIASPMTDGIGMFYWRDYDNNNHRALVKAAEVIGATDKPLKPTDPARTGPARGDPTAAIASAMATPDRVYRDDYGAYYRDRLSLVQPVTGEAEYVRALQKFTDAVAADPGNATARRHLYMALAEKNAWADLLRETDRALRVNEDDIDAWLARGIAASAQQDYDNAAGAFDNGLKRMSGRDRASFTSIKRLLSPSSNGLTRRFADALQWDSLPDSERRRQETLFWNLADPRASTRVNEALMEYYARVAYADLRFGSEEYRIRGADSDRGKVWVRYGPPTDIYSVPGDLSQTSIIWVYDRPSLAYVFVMRPTFGTAYVPFGDTSADSIKTENPVGWGNLPLVRRTWPMRMRAARFRSSADSMDVVVTATVPVRSFLEGADLAGPMPIHVQLDVHDPSARIVGRELRKVTVSSDSLPVGINGTWVRRLGRGANVVRIDADQPDVNRAASNAIDTPIDTTSGFGISDLLLGTNPQRVGSTDPARWRDISIAPTTGVFPWAQSVGVVWELYDLAPADGSVKYRVNLHLQRTFATSLKGFVARIAAYSKNVMERNGSGTGTVAVAYDQSRPASAIVADFVSVNLDGSVPGTYKLTIEIEDLVSKRITRRTTTFDLTRN